MTRLSKVFVAALALQMALATSPFAAEEIGKAVAITVSVTGDPRFGLQSPIPTTLNVNTPGGKAGTLTNTRTATLSDPNNPLSLTSQTDTVNFNGRTATRTYNATTRTATDTSPAGRKRTTVTDPQGRVTQQQQGTLAPTSFSYDARGRLATRSQGGRNAAMTYPATGSSASARPCASLQGIPADRNAASAALPISLVR